MTCAMLPRKEVAELGKGPPEPLFLFTLAQRQVLVEDMEFN